MRPAVRWAVAASLLGAACAEPVVSLSPSDVELLSVDADVSDVSPPGEVAGEEVASVPDLSPPLPDGAEPPEADTAPVPPTAPAVAGTHPASPANDNQPFIYGIADAWTTVRVYRDPECIPPALGAAAAGGDGVWQVSGWVPDDSETPLFVRATGRDGASSPCAATLTYVEDSTPPSPPSELLLDPSGPSPDPQPALAGVAEPGATVVAYRLAGCLGPAASSGISQADGRFELPLPVALDVTSRVSARARDAAGNLSECSDWLTYDHDGTPPAEPVVTGTEPEGVTSTPFIVVTGTAEPHSLVHIHPDPACEEASLGEDYASPAGDFAVQVALPGTGFFHLHAQAQDALDQRSRCSTTFGLHLVDGSPPSAPLLSHISPEGPSPEAWPVLRGQAETHALLRVYRSADCTGAPVGSGYAGSGGGFAVSFEAAIEATTAVSARAWDEAGWSSPCTATPLSYTHDATAPEPPTLLQTVPASPSRSVWTPLVQLTAEPGIQLALFTGGVCDGSPALSTVMPLSGAAMLEVPVPKHAVSELVAQVRDAAGNASLCSQPLEYVHDGLPPTFAGVTTATATGPTALELSWAAAIDQVYPAEELVYDVCLAASPVAATACVEPHLTSSDLSATIAGLASDTRYYANVRARDPAGNSDDNGILASARTLGGGGAIGVSLSGGRTCVTLADGRAACSDVPGGPLSLLDVAEVALVEVDDAGWCSLGVAGDLTCDGDPAPVGQARSFSLGGGSRCAIGPAGGVSCWSATDLTAPPSAQPARAIAVHGQAVCSVTEAGAVVCWGAGPAAAAPPGLPPTRAVALGESHGCALAASGGVQCWGSDAVGQATVPGGLPPARAIAASADGTCVVTAPGELVCWGTSSASGLTGPFRSVGLSAGRVCAVSVPGRVSCRESGGAVVDTPLQDASVRAIAVAAGFGHGCAASSDGQVSCWGWNDDAQLGDASLEERWSPQLVAGFPGRGGLAAGSYHSCALGPAGDVACWGGDGFGALGNGALPASASPTPVALGPSREVRSAASHTCATLVDGRVACWGWNGRGQLGDGSTEDRAEPFVSQADTLEVAVAATHSCGLRGDGTVWCWGEGGRGQLGQGSFGDAVWPVQVQGLAGAIAVAAGGDRSCAIRADGSLWCWGDVDPLGRACLGGCWPAVQPVPVQVAGLPAVRGVSMGKRSSCVLGVDGRVRCWGELPEWPYVPEAVPGLSARSVAVGSDHACAVGAAGRLTCWGRNDHGQHGTGLTARRPLPSDVVGLQAAIAVTGGGRHGCARGANQAVTCWGGNDSGQLGFGSTLPAFQPVPPAGLSTARALSAGAAHTCVVDEAGQAFCWGRNDHGQLGGGDTTPTWTPSAVAQSEPFLSIAASGGEGAAHTCAVTTGGNVRCWGSSGAGQLGTGTFEPHPTPAAVVGLADVAQVAAGAAHTCARRLGGQVGGEVGGEVGGQIWCWGAGHEGQLGDGGMGLSTDPVGVVGIEGATALAAGLTFNCAATSAGDVRCWGRNSRGQLGDGSQVGQATPTAVGGGLADAVDVVAGASHACALLTDTTVRCWGANTEGQLGDGTFVDRSTPVQVVGLADVVALGAGANHTCAVLVGGGVQCWGSDADHQLGDGVDDAHSGIEPRYVSDFP